MSRALSRSIVFRGHDDVLPNTSSGVRVASMIAVRMTVKNVSARSLTTEISYPYVSLLKRIGPIGSILHLHIVH
jgi:hypothetical protein